MPNPHFQKSALPVPRPFYERELGRLSRADRNGRVRANCPFHRSKSRTTFSINLRSGAFHCFSCGARGGDAIDFVRLRDGLSFREAAKSLGAWDSSTPSPETVRRLAAAERERKKRRHLVEELRAKEHAQRILLREQVHLAIAFQRDAERRLDELHAGAAPITANEAEKLWTVMSLSFDYEREMAREYLIASGLEVRDGH